MSVFENGRIWDDSAHSYTFSDDCGWGKWKLKRIDPNADVSVTVHMKNISFI